MGSGCWSRPGSPRIGRAQLLASRRRCLSAGSGLSGAFPGRCGMGLPNAGSSPSSKPSQRAGGRGVGRAQWPHPARECHALLQYRGGEDALCAWTFGRVRRHSWRPQRNAPRSRKSGTSAPARLTSIAPALPSLGRVRRHEERQVANSFSGLRRRPNARRRLVPPRRAQLPEFNSPDQAKIVAPVALRFGRHND